MLKQVTDSLLVRNNLTLSDLPNVFDTLAQRNVDYADLYFQLSQDETMRTGCAWYCATFSV